MNFFEAQRSATQRTRLLVLLFVAAVVAIVVANYLAFHVFLVVSADDVAAPMRSFPDPTLFTVVAAVTLLVILSGTAFRTAKLRRGGPAVAELVGGRAVDPSTTDPAERRLLNVVEEMAIASGVPVPAVYVLDEDGINAFAAGHTIHDAAVAVTHGALETLDRDELQGVVAHEFSHILNGDMRLNVRLIGLLFGILLVAVIGRSLLSGGRFSSRRRGRNSSVLLALALLAIGYVGVLFGRLIKAAISRQREFLADAAAVQFTRNPDGIAGALQKIGGYGTGARVQAGHVEELSHLFFANALGRNLFATHPPLVERIRRIDPSFDGEFPEVESAPGAVAGAAAFAEGAGAGPDAAPSRTPMTDAERDDDTGWSRVVGAVESDEPPAGRGREAPVAAEAAGLVGSIGNPGAEHVSRAARLLQSLPEELDAAARSPGGAQALVLALLIDAGDSEVARSQREAVCDHGGDGLVTWVDDLAPRIRTQPREARLALVDLAIPALERLPSESAARFRRAVQELIRADGRLHLFEYALFRILSRHLPTAEDDEEESLADEDGAGRRHRRTVRSLARLRDDAAVVLSAVARSGAGDEADAAAAFATATAALPADVGELRLLDRDDVRLPRVERALNAFEHASLDVRRGFLEACAACVAHDGQVLPSEFEILRAVAAALDCPMPPLLAGTGPAARRASSSSADG